MNLPQTAGCNLGEIMNIMYCQMFFSLYDSISSPNPQVTVRARRTEKKGKDTQRQDPWLLALVGLPLIQLVLKSAVPH